MRLLLVYNFCTLIITLFGSMIVLWTFTLARPRRALTALSFGVGLIVSAVTITFLSDDQSYKRLIFLFLTTLYALPYLLYPKVVVVCFSPIRLLLFQAKTALRLLIITSPFLLVAVDLSAHFHPSQMIAICVLFISAVGLFLAKRACCAFLKNPFNAGKSCHEGIFRLIPEADYLFAWGGQLGFTLFVLALPYGELALIPLIFRTIENLFFDKGWRMLYIRDL